MVWHLCDNEPPWHNCTEPRYVSAEGEPAAFLVMFDRVNNRIALKPTAATMKHAYFAGKYGRRGGRRVRAFRLLTEYGIKITETIEFKDAEIDTDGQLILDLRSAKVSPRARARNPRAKI